MVSLDLQKGYKVKPRYVITYVFKNKLFRSFEHDLVNAIYLAKFIGKKYKIGTNITKLN